jgi:hypothetical protein
VVCQQISCNNVESPLRKIEKVVSDDGEASLLQREKRIVSPLKSPSGEISASVEQGHQFRRRLDDDNRLGAPKRLTFGGNDPLETAALSSSPANHSPTEVTFTLAPSVN